METPPPLPKPADNPDEPIPWHRPIGVVVIIIGVLGVLTGALQIGQAYMGNIGGVDPSEQEFDVEAMQAVVEKWQPVSMAMGAIYIPVALLLTVGGILLVRKRLVSAFVLRFWAILKLIVVAVNAYFQLLMAREQMAVMFTEETIGSEAPFFQSITDVTIVVFLVLTVLWMSAVPVFLLFWFGRARIRVEMKSWKHVAG